MVGIKLNVAQLAPFHAGSQTQAAGVPLHTPFKEQSASLVHEGGPGPGAPQPCTRAASQPEVTWSDASPAHCVEAEVKQWPDLRFHENWSQSPVHVAWHAATSFCVVLAPSGTAFQSSTSVQLAGEGDGPGGGSAPVPSTA